MSDRYLCVHCDVRFEHDETEALRCPKCMRKTGLEKVAVPKKTQRPSYLVPAIVAGTVMALAVAYVVQTRPSEDGEVVLAPLDEERLTREAASAGIEDSELADLFSADDALRSFASAAARGKSGNVEKARAVVAKLRTYAREGRFTSLPMHTPRDTPPLTAARALAALRPNARLHAYPIEIAAIAVAALRAEGVDAMLAEVSAYPRQRTPPDPSGRVGYYVVAVYADDVGEGTPVLLDPFGGRTETPAQSAYRVLTDAQALGAMHATHALYMLVQSGDVAGAMEQAQGATTLDERSPQARCVRAAVLISSGGMEEGEAELRAAVDLRNGPAQQANLAGVYIATNRTAEATRALDAALESAPDYVYAIVLRAAVHIARNETDEAKAALERAEALERDFYMLPMLWAEYFLRKQDPMSAVARVQQAIELRPRDYQTLFQAARVFQIAGQHESAVTTARRALELVPPDQKDALRERMEGLLGRGSLGDDEDGGEPAEPTGATDPALDLSRGSRLLGGGSTGGGPRLFPGGLRLGGGQ